MNDIYLPVDRTADGCWYFAGQTHGAHVYFDIDCNSGGVDGMWIVDADEPSTTAMSDLDGDSNCVFNAYIYDDGVDPPFGTDSWGVYCGSWTTTDLALTEAPDRPFSVSGSCDWNLNDAFYPVARTADDRWYYKGQTHGYQVYFGVDCDSTTNVWMFNTGEPSTTATSDLNGDGSCASWAQIFDDGIEPPFGTNEWSIYCTDADGQGDTWVTTDLTLADITPTQLPTGPALVPTISSAPSMTPSPTRLHEVSTFVQLGGSMSVSGARILVAATTISFRYFAP